MRKQALRFTNNVTWSHKKNITSLLNPFKKIALLINLPAYFGEERASIFILLSADLETGTTLWPGLSR